MNQEWVGETSRFTLKPWGRRPGGIDRSTKRAAQMAPTMASGGRDQRDGARLGGNFISHLGGNAGQQALRDGQASDRFSLRLHRLLSRHLRAAQYET
jgi:hypothetical protein